MFSRMQELVVRVTLPGISSVSGVQLDVSRCDISVHVPGKYLLQSAPLPFPVDSDRGRAKFDKARGQLEVVLPVLVPPLPAFQPAKPLVEPVVAPEDQPDAAAPSGDEVTSTAGGSAAARVDQHAASDVGSPEQQLMPSQPDSSAAASTASEAMTENEKRWADLHVAPTADAESGGESGQQHQPSAEPSANPVPTAVAAAVVAARPPAPAVTLKPRLKSNIAEELD